MAEQKSRIVQIGERLKEASARYLYAATRVKEEKKALEEAEAHTANIEEAQKIVQHVAQAIQNHIHQQIAGVVTQCLQTVFVEDHLSFSIEFTKSRGKTEAVLSLIENGSVMDPLDSSAGGVVDIVSFALRIASLELCKPSLRMALILDEPFKNINGKIYQRRMGKLLTELAEARDLQIIMVTDDDWLKIGHVIEF